MQFTRREFVSSSVLGAAAVSLTGLGVPSDDESRPRCVVLDLGAGCTIRESIAGYRRATARLTARGPTLIVPAALTIPRAAIESHLWHGGLVVLESGAGFADGRSFAAHRDALRDALQLHVEPPRTLWPRQTPYIHFDWPTFAMTRDFSSVVPLASQHGRVIAVADGLPVALVRRARLGRLIFLGSPLGPTLWTDDPHATHWLRTLLEQDWNHSLVRS